MGLYKRGRNWWLRVTFKKKQIRRSLRTTNKKRAEKYYYKILTEIEEGIWGERLPGEEKNLKEMVEKYLKEHSIINKTPKSFDRDKELADHLISFFGDLKLTQIRPKNIYDYKIKRREEGASARTINYELSLLSHAFTLAIKEWEWVKENPVKKVAKEKVNNMRERWLTYEEEEKLLNASPKWLKELIIFSLETGLRQGEVLTLQWSQVDFARKTITIFEQKNRAKDILPLNERALEILKERAKIRHIKANYVFYNKNGNSIMVSNLQRAFSLAKKRANIEDLRWHDLRHTFATRLIQAGVDLYTVQKLGRWKTIQMVMRYAHHYPESLRVGIETLDRVRKQFSTNLAQSYGVQKINPL